MLPTQDLIASMKKAAQEREDEAKRLRGALDVLSPKAPKQQTAKRTGSRKRKISAETRKRMSEAQKARFERAKTPA